MRFKVNCQPWQLLRKPMGKVWGICDPDKRTITVHDDMDGWVELDTHVHEFLHAAFPWLKESVVRQVSIELSAFLWRLGFRRHDPAKQSKVARKRAKKPRVARKAAKKEPATDGGDRRVD